MGKKILKNIINNLEELYQDVINLSKKEVEEKYGYQGHTIRSFLKRNEYNVKTFVEYDGKRKLKLFKELFYSGLSVPEISKQTGHSDDCIYSVLKKIDIDYTDRSLNCNLDIIKKEYKDEEFKIYKYDTRYAISNYGRIYSFIRSIFVREYVEKEGRNKGYVRYNLAGKHQSKHRAVAEHFIENPNNFVEVNHIDRDRQNNYYKNLEWCDRTYNVRYSINEDILKNKKIVARENGMKNAIRVICIEDNMEFESISECARYYGIKHSELITRVCKGRNSYCKDFKGRKLTFTYYEKTDEGCDNNEQKI